MRMMDDLAAATWAEPILDAADRATRAIPPAFPLDATVAVNPFLGQAHEDLAAAAARLARVGGEAPTRPRNEMRDAIAAGRISDDDLAGALAASPHPQAPADLAALKAAAAVDRPTPAALPTVTDLAAAADGIDWAAVFHRTFGLWAAGRFDRGQALWTPAPGQSAFVAWRAWATHDLTPEIAGLAGFCAHVAAAPDTPERAILRAAGALGLTVEAAETAFHRLLADLAGWAQHARWLQWRAELEGGREETARDLLAIRLVWEEALLAARPALAAEWASTVAAHAAPVAPGRDDVIDAILQDAAERAFQRGLGAALARRRPPARARAELQAVFCIDVRSEVFRRALESCDPDVETLGFAGFFGLPLAHAPHASDVVEARLPALLAPTMGSTSQVAEAAERSARIAARAVRAWGRFRQAAVSSFAFIEAAGPLYGAKLLADSLGRGGARPAAPAPRLADGVTTGRRAETAAAILKATGLSAGCAPVVLLVGHGARVTNNPHESAYHCGACGGHAGDVSARMAASLLNDPLVRDELPALGVDLPDGALFVAALHDTTTDEVTLFDDDAPADRAAALGRARRSLAQAGRLARAERAPRLAGARPETLASRATNWAEPRPEWGLAGCAAFIAAPRAATAGVDLGGRAFLHSYDWRADEGFATLELILTAPVVVAGWIGLQYYGSTVAPGMFGCGDKLIHNVVGGIGVVQGNGGRLRAGLPWQAVHDGERLVHEPLRLSVMVEAPRDAIADILGRHPQLRGMFDNGWMHLFALREGRVAARHVSGLGWREEPDLPPHAA